LKFGTLSFERRLDEMVLSAAQRRDCIVHVASTYAPDLLLCAGWSLENDANLTSSAKTFAFRRPRRLYVEVRDSAGAREPGVKGNRVYLVGRNNYVRPLGWQAFVEGEELKGKEKDRHLALFEKFIPEKSAIVEGKKLFVLCCGEINVLEGRNLVDARSNVAKHALLDADIIVNPTHDRMGNVGNVDREAQVAL
jgi:hypothetical protein